MERSYTHDDDPEHRKDEQDILGKMLNMIGSLRQELAKLWTKNEVLEKELAELRPRENAVCDCSSVQDPEALLCDNEGDREKALQPPPNEGDGGEAVSCAEPIRSALVEVEEKED